MILPETWKADASHEIRSYGLSESAVWLNIKLVCMGMVALSPSSGCVCIPLVKLLEQQFQTVREMLSVL